MSDPIASNADTPPLAPPGYEILGELGKGGMGVVYRAQDCALDRPVALKYLLPNEAGNPKAVARFDYEARITARLQHPGIPPVHQVGTLPDGRPFLAMKLIEGRTLAALLREQGPGATHWLGVFEAICQAVGYAHSQGVIHRDLKPANVMVGAFGEVQVMDWGLAKSLSARADSRRERDTDDSWATTGPEDDSATPAATDPTRAGTVLGTPAFMPPEQAIEALNRLRRCSDVFGLGAILCALLTGKPPFVGPDGEATRQLAARAELDDAFARLDASGSESELIALAKRCLSANQDERPQDGGELARMIAELRRQAEERARQAELERVRTAVHAEEQASQARLEKAHALAQVEEQRKHRRVLLVAASVLIVVLLAGIVGTTFGQWQAVTKRKDAEEQLKRGDKQNRLTADALNDLVFGIQDKLATRPDTQDLRKELLEKARRGLQILIDDAERQGSPASTLVWSHFRMGDIDLLLGNTQSARAEYETAHDLAKRLVEADPRNAQAQRDLGICLDRLGNVTLKLGKTKEALEFYEKALAVRQPLADADPSNSEAQRDLAVSFNRLGDVTLQLGRTKAALDFYEKALEVRQRLADDAPSDPDVQRDLSVSFDKMGEVTLQLGKSKEAMDFYKKMLEISQRLADVDPKHAQAQRNLSVCLERLGDVKLMVGKTSDALDDYRRSLEVSQRLVVADPRNAQAQRDLSISFDRLGDVMLKLGKAKEALGFYQKSLAVRQPLADADPTNAQGQRDLVVCFDKLGDVTLRLGQTKEALDYIQKSLAVSQRLADADPRNAATQRDLSIGFDRLGDAMIKLGRTKEALDFFQKALKIRQPLADADPSNAETQRDLAVNFDRLGDVTLKLDKVKEALGFYQKSLAVRQRLANAEPQNAQAQRDLNISFSNVGDVTLQLGATKQALDLYKRSLTVCQALADAAPRNTEAQTTLFVSFWKLGSAEIVGHDYAKASDWFTQGRAVLLPLHERKLLVGQFQSAIPQIDQQITFSTNAANAVARLSFVFTQKPDLAPSLLNLRVRALLHHNQVGEAIRTAECWRDWAETRDKDRDTQRYNAACALALCAGKSKEKNVLVARTVAVLVLLRDEGYLADAKMHAHFEQDADFAAVRDHPAFVAFVRSLKQ